MAHRGSIKPRKPSILRNFIKSKVKRAAPSKRTRKDCYSRSAFSVAPIQAQNYHGHDSDDPHVGLYGDEPGQCEDMSDFDAVGCGGDDGDEEARSVKRRKRSYSEQQRKQDEAWDTVVLSLHNKYLSRPVFGGDLECCLCSGKALYRCMDCGPLIHYCEECCVMQHSNRCFYHVPERWESGHFAPVMLSNIVIPLDHGCLTERREKVTIVSMKGYHHGITICFCKCKSMIERMVDLRLWPATPNCPQVAFDMDLLDVVHAAMVECQVSLHHACNMLWCLAVVKSGKERKKTYQQLLVSFPRFRCFQSIVKTNQSQLSGCQQSVNCPACPKDDTGTCFISLDGNFRLCRRKKAGEKTNYKNPLTTYQLFASQPDVDLYVNKSPQLLQRDCESDKLQCHEFKAGDALRSKSRYHALDETGVFGATCRHDIPLKMLSMKQGEKLAYADYVLSKLVEEGKVAGHVNLLYDIGCKIVSHWKRSPEHFNHLSSTFNVAVSVFHAYAHNSRCQYLYSPRHRIGFGLSDGENLERLWSFLGKFCHMTKEMNTANRIDTLSDALQHYAQQKSAKMETSIVERMKKAFDTKEKLTKEVEVICNSVGITVDQLKKKLPELREEEIKRLDSIARKPVVTNHIESWRLKYVQYLQSWFKLQEKWTDLLRDGVILTPEVIVETVAKLERLESDLKAIESQYHIDLRWQRTSTEYLDVLRVISVSEKQVTKGKLLGVVRERVFYLNTLRHHAGGQKQAQRISKLISMCTSKAKGLLDEYKGHCTSAGDSTGETTLEDVFNMNSPFWNLDHTYVLQPIDCIPVVEQRRLIEIADVLARCSEELQYCISDILNMHTFFSQCLINLNLKLYSNVSSGCEYPDETDIDPSEYQMYSTVGQFVDSSTNSLSHSDVEVLSAGISQAEYVCYRLLRINDVTKSLVMAYWTTSQQEREAHIKKALFCSEQPISVPYISKLIVQHHTDIDDMVTCTQEDRQSDQFQNDSNITSDEEVELDSSPCSTDTTETDEDECTD